MPVGQSKNEVIGRAKANDKPRMKSSDIRLIGTGLTKPRLNGPVASHIDSLQLRSQVIPGVIVGLASRDVHLELARHLGQRIGRACLQRMPLPGRSQGRSKFVMHVRGRLGRKRPGLRIIADQAEVVERG